MSTTSARNRPPPKTSLVPGLAFLPGFTKVSQTLSSPRLSSSTSTLPPVSSRSPINLAGITFVSFNTRQSPGFKYSVISRNMRCVISPVCLSKIIKREDALSESGSCAINSSGRSYAKSDVFILILHSFFTQLSFQKSLQF